MFYLPDFNSIISVQLESLKIHNWSIDHCTSALSMFQITTCPCDVLIATYDQIMLTYRHILSDLILHNFSLAAGSKYCYSRKLIFESVKLYQNKVLICAHKIQSNHFPNYLCISLKPVCHF